MTNTPMRMLIDDLSRKVGVAETSVTLGTIVEYGGRDHDGILHVTGRARVARITAKDREAIDAGLGLGRVWAV